jgi:hypothetical protein
MAGFGIIGVEPSGSATRELAIGNGISKYRKNRFEGARTVISLKVLQRAFEIRNRLGIGDAEIRCRRSALSCCLWRQPQQSANTSPFAFRPFLSTSGGHCFRLHDAVHMAEFPLQKPILQNLYFFNRLLYYSQ